MKRNFIILTTTILILIMVIIYLEVLSENTTTWVQVLPIVLSWVGFNHKDAIKDLFQKYREVEVEKAINTYKENELILQKEIKTLSENIVNIKEIARKTTENSHLLPEKLAYAIICVCILAAITLIAIYYAQNTLKKTWLGNILFPQLSIEKYKLNIQKNLNSIEESLLKLNKLTEGLNFPIEGIPYTKFPALRLPKLVTLDVENLKSRLTHTHKMIGCWAAGVGVHQDAKVLFFHTVWVLDSWIKMTNVALAFYESVVPNNCTKFKTPAEYDAILNKKIEHADRIRTKLFELVKLTKDLCEGYTKRIDVQQENLADFKNMWISIETQKESDIMINSDEYVDIRSSLL